MYNRLIVLFLILASCSHQTTQELNLFQGQIMGTTYSVKIPESDPTFGQKIQEYLESINAQVSTYEPRSIISIINATDSCVSLADYPSDHFMKVFNACQDVFRETDGYFDPTVGPLVDYWGFGVEKDRVDKVDTVMIQKLLGMVNFDSMTLHGNTEKICKQMGQQLNLNAIAKGYAVDQLVNELKNTWGYAQGVVEIGGETRVFGQKQDQSPWTIGVNTPSENASTREIIQLLKLNDESIATSGDYRIFYESNGEKFVHIINPHTGFPEESNLVSVSVIHKECMIADGFATGLLASGLERGLTIANRVPSIEAYFIYFDDDGKYKFASSQGFAKYIIE